MLTLSECSALCDKLCFWWDGFLNKTPNTDYQMYMYFFSIGFSLKKQMPWVCSVSGWIKAQITHQSPKIVIYPISNCINFSKCKPLLNPVTLPSCVSFRSSSATHGLWGSWWLQQRGVLCSVWRRPHCCSRLCECLCETSHFRFPFNYVVDHLSVLLAFCPYFKQRYSLILPLYWHVLILFHRLINDGEHHPQDMSP